MVEEVSSTTTNQPESGWQGPHCSSLPKHAGQMRRVFSELSPEELQGLEVALKKIGKRAAALMEQCG